MLARNGLHDLKAAVEILLELHSGLVNSSPTEGIWLATLTNVWNVTFIGCRPMHAPDMKETCGKKEAQLFVTALD